MRSPDADDNVFPFQYISNLEVEHRQLLQLVESQKIELRNGKDLIKNLQKTIQQKRSRNHSSSTESSLEEETYPKNALMDSASQKTLETDAIGSPWPLAYSQPSIGDSDLKGILNDFVSTTPMPTRDMIGELTAKTSIMLAHEVDMSLQEAIRS